MRGVRALRASLPRCDRRQIALAVIGGSVLLSWLSGRAAWWVVLIAAVSVSVIVTIPVLGRTAADWMMAAGRYRFGRGARARRSAAEPVVADMEVASGMCGIHRDGTTFVGMIQLAPNLDLPTVVGESSAYTEDTVPIAALAALLDQYGPVVDIDIVTTGRRIRQVGGYGPLYDQLIGSHPVIGDRLTWLVLRLDAVRNRAVLSRRGPCEVTAPKALAAAVHRIAMRLRQRGTAAHALPAEAMRQAIALLGAGVDIAELTERWGRLESRTSGTCVTSFSVDPNAFGSSGFDEIWTHCPGRTTVVTSLTREAEHGSPYALPHLLRTGVPGRQVTAVRSLVRYVGPAVPAPPLSGLRPLGGRQADALAATMPTGKSCAAAGLGTAVPVDAIVDKIRTPIGPSGQILGAISGPGRRTLAVPLYDPARYQTRRRTIDVHATLPVVQQIVLRSAVVGADVEIHSNRPERWRQLVSAVGDANALRLAAAGDAGNGLSSGPDADLPTTIAVFDRTNPSATAAHTTIRVTDPGTPSHPSAHLTIDQISDRTMTIRLPRGAVRVDLIEPAGESRYLDSQRDFETSTPSSNGTSANSGSTLGGRAIPRGEG